MTSSRTPRPNPLPWFYRWRTNLLQAPAFFLWTIVCGSLSLFASLFEKDGRVQHSIARLWARGSVACSFAPLTVRGVEHLAKCPVAVYASNHTSYMDTPVLFATLPFQFRILARKELWSIPFIGWHLNRSGQIPIAIGDTHASLSSLGAGARALRGGMPLVVFPEGGRTTDGHLKPFLAGAAFLAIRAQVPLVPIALSGVYDLLPIHTHHFFPCPLTLSVGEPIDTKGMSIRQVNDLTETLKQRIESLLAR